MNESLLTIEDIKSDAHFSQIYLDRRHVGLVSELPLAAFGEFIRQENPSRKQAVQTYTKTSPLYFVDQDTNPAVMLFSDGKLDLYSGGTIRRSSELQIYDIQDASYIAAAIKKPIMRGPYALRYRVVGTQSLEVFNRALQGIKVFG